MATKTTKSSDASTEQTTSGITYNSDGQRVIPASQRQDGTVRKERKVRPGFTPAEDVKRYHNRTAEAFRTRGSGGIPGATAVVADLTPSAAAAANKNAKRRAARKKKAANDKDGGEEEEGEDGDDVEDLDPAEDVIEDNKTASTTATATTTSTDTADKQGISKETIANNAAEREKEKQARNIRKKLAQAKELQSRREKGETLLPEQIQKALKLQELTRELEKLGLDV